MGKSNLFLKLFFMLSATIITAQMDFRQTYKLQYGKCFPNNKTLRIFERTLEQCLGECRRRPSCASVNYKRPHKLCEINDKPDNAKDEDCSGVIFSRRSEWLEDVSLRCDPACNDGEKCEEGEEEDCIVKECGPIVNVEDALVYGNRREVGSKLKYVCKNRPVQALVECGIDGNWTKRPVCKEKSIGKKCTTKTDCWETNSLCIDNICFCTYLAKYDKETGECKKECETNAAIFNGTPEEKAIEKFNINNNCPQKKSYQECKTACEESDKYCASIDYSDSSGECCLGKINVQQLRDAGLLNLLNKDTHKTYSRVCNVSSG